MDRVTTYLHSLVIAYYNIVYDMAVNHVTMFR